MEKLGVFVTAKLRGINGCRQGVIIRLKPLRIKGISDAEYDCEGDPVLVKNPPENCFQSDLPPGNLCKSCRDNFKVRPVNPKCFNFGI